MQTCNRGDGPIDNRSPGVKQSRLQTACLTHVRLERNEWGRKQSGCMGMRCDRHTYAFGVMHGPANAWQQNLARGYVARHISPGNT